ncbi:hypothetical protein JTE90_026282 [Oedothorax gibbosus]|uniref:Uncharacterized protein n=1 Tax=Oedothorax gibbosus TaxID=931172 RepID=A0AAV6U1G7_9ARAC|nr:hypothetical protein JTE90_026282 [Oedothorax gibbosus]
MQPKSSVASVLISLGEFIRETFCWNHDFRLDCSWNSVLAIHEAFFTNDEAQLNRSSCLDTRDGREPCTEDVRDSVNRRCSGMSHCHYNLTEDHQERQCRCKGVIVLLYSCVPAEPQQVDMADPYNSSLPRQMVQQQQYTEPRATVEPKPLVIEQASCKRRHALAAKGITK